ncbi:hypothetical protein NST12_16920 [Bacillus sp. FSL W8-1127]|uniref:hypothetical protein n=1 Tax=Bacillus sp. FSL W8-1127 TaxID=2954710 RepID=UPI0030F8794E
MTNEENILNYIKALESIKDSFHPKRYKYRLAEAFVLLFSLKTQSKKKIWSMVNKELKQRGLGKVSYSFVYYSINPFYELKL